MTHQMPKPMDNMSVIIEARKAHFCHPTGRNFSFNRSATWKPKAATARTRTRLTEYVSCAIVIDCQRMKLPLGSSTLVALKLAKAVRPYLVLRFAAFAASKESREI